MESEKVKEIKKALEDNANYSEHTHLAYIDDYRVKLVAYRDILTLINELESENKQLLEENESLNGSWKMQLKKIAELEKEIEENAFYSKGYAQGIKNTYEVVVPEKLKQFAERLKEKMYENENGYIEFFTGKNAIAVDVVDFENCLDEILEEFMEVE